MSHIDLLIIGAGPIGISCGIEAEKQGVDYKIIDKGCLVNSIHNFPTEMTFFSSSENLELAGLPFNSLARRPSKRETLEYYRRVTDHFQLKLGLYETFESVTTIKNNTAYFLVTTSKERYTCNYIINATGFYDIPVLMNIPGEHLPKLHHYFTSAHHLYNQKLVVIGASNSAVDVAMEGYRKGAEVTVLVRKDQISKSVKYWVKPDFEGRVKEGHITVYYNSEVEEIKEKSIVFNQKGKQIELENDFVYAMTGYQPNFDLMEKLGIALDTKNGIPKYNEGTMETTANRVYLAGVVCGGRNTREWYIENSRGHGEKIIKHILNNNA